MENIQISFNPQKANLDEIENWMFEETKLETFQNGNWPAVEFAFDKKRLVIAIIGEKTVGFYALSRIDLTASIYLAQVHPDFRNKGIGKFILEEIIRQLENTNTYAIDLYCSPESSQIVWKRLGFDYFPENSEKNRFEKPTMYKIIKPFLKPCLNKIGNENEVIEIWNDKEHKAYNKEPTWIWELEFVNDTRKLRKPIVHFGDCEWRIRWRKGEIIFKDCVYKNFNKNNDCFSCIIITELQKKVTSS